MKKMLIILICLILLVGCKDKNSIEEKNESKEPEGEIINVKTNTNKWADTNVTLSDSLNNKEVINEYSMSIPAWEAERKEDYVLFKNDNIFLVMLYKNEYYIDDKITDYKKLDSKKVNINSFNAEFEEGDISYNKASYKYVSYYIDNNIITIKLIGISKERKINELNNMIKAMIESLEKENFAE